MELLRSSKFYRHYTLLIRKIRYRRAAYSCDVDGLPELCDLLRNRLYHTGGQAFHGGHQEELLVLPGSGNRRVCCRRHFYLCAEVQLRQFTPPWGRALLSDVRTVQCDHEYCQLELGCVCAKLRSEVPQRQKQARDLWQRGGAALLHFPPDHHPLRWLVCDTLEYRHSVQVFDHCRGLLCTDHGLVQGACQTLQRGAVFLLHATKEDAGNLACRTSGRVWCLMVKRPLGKNK